MPPSSRTRSGRSERLANEPPVLAGPVNTHGFPSLPVELLLEVVSYLEVRVPIPSHKQSVYDARYLAHHDALRSLSQTSRSLRNIFLPLVWRRIEVCASKCKSRQVIARDVATELVRQLEIVTIRDPTLAQYVQVVNVIIQDYCYNRVLVELARCLALFPNLHTLQVLGSGLRIKDTTRKVFKGLTFPQIRTLVANSNGYDILAACPNVEKVTCVDRDYKDFWKTVFEHCPNVVSLGGFGNKDCTRFINAVSRKLQNLEEITFDVTKRTFTPEALCNLSVLKRLHTVCFDFTNDNPTTPGRTSRATAWPSFISQRKAVMVAFKDIPQRDDCQKRLILKFEHKDQVYKFDASVS